MSGTIRFDLVSKFHKDKLFDRHFVNGLLQNRYYKVSGVDSQGSYMSPIVKTNNLGNTVIYTRATHSDMGLLRLFERLISTDQSIFIDVEHVTFLDLIEESEIQTLSLSVLDFPILLARENHTAYAHITHPPQFNESYDILNYFIEENDMSRGIAILNQKEFGNETKILLMNYSSQVIEASSVKICFLVRSRQRTASTTICTKVKSILSSFLP